jgi:hypothetical protein
VWGVVRNRKRQKSPPSRRSAKSSLVARKKRETIPGLARHVMNAANSPKTI